MPLAHTVSGRDHTWGNPYELPPLHPMCIHTHFKEWLDWTECSYLGLHWPGVLTDGNCP